MENTQGNMPQRVIVHPHDETIDFLIKNVAIQKASAVTIIEMLAKNEEDAQARIAKMNERIEKNIKDLFDHLMENREKID